MGGKRHKGIGFNRPRKTRVIQAELPSAALENTSSAEITALSPPAELQGPSSEPSEVQRAPPASTADPDPRSELMQRCIIACRSYRKARRAWYKSYQTHYCSDTYSTWDEPSIVARCKRRMRKADADLKETEARFVAAKREWSLVNSLIQLEKSARQFPEFSKFKELAAERLAAFRAAPPEPVSGFSSLDGVDALTAVSAEHFGLEQTFSVGELYAQHDF